jgi:hypothetical protein
MLKPFGRFLECSNDTQQTQLSREVIAADHEVIEEGAIENDYDFGDDDDQDDLNDYLESNKSAYLKLSDGKWQHKSNAINSILYKSTISRSTDRLIRVRTGLDLNGFEEDGEIFSQLQNDKCIKLTDMLFSLVTVKRVGLCIALIVINRIQLNGRYSYFIEHNDFKSATFFGRVLKFSEPVEDDKIKWSNNYGQLIEVKGKDSMMFEMQSNSSDQNKIESYICTKDLAEAKEILDMIYNEYNEPPLFETIEAPYHPSIHYFFKLASKTPFTQGDKPECKLCKVNVDIALMRLHVAWHYFNGDIQDEFCGYCGTKCSSSLSLRLTSGSKVNGTYKTASNCKYFYPFSMKSCTKQSTNNPCSNRAYICQLCNNTAIWTYNLALHYEQKHEGMDCPVKITTEEKNLILSCKNAQK